jgi:HPt (histidine-containing phosphotransfer) domain-containing protein
MYFYGALIVLVVIVGLIIYNEIQKNKRYEEERQARLKKRRQPKDTLKVRVKQKEESVAKPTPKPKVQKQPVKEEPKVQPKPEVKPEPKPIKEQPKEVKKEPIKEEPKPQVDTKPTVKAEPSVRLPECNYPDFDHSRLMEMGLGEDDAHAFVGELINQIDEQLPKLQDAIDDKNVEQVERLTHSMKGSSSNIGVGGVTDLLIEFNTYTKSKSNFAVIKEYFNQLKVYLQKLKDQYS